MNEGKVYEKRVVAFIDILGFKNMVKNTEADNIYAKKLLNLMNYIDNERKDNYEGILAQNEIGKEVTVFSDSIIISYPISLGGSLFYILMDLIHLQMALIMKEVLFRGGVVIGDVYHSNNTVFGPAVIEAYELESKHARYPRIILDKDTILMGIKHLAEQNTYDMEAKYILGLLRKDEDNFYFLDYMKQYQELDYNEDYYLMMLSIKKMIYSSLKNFNDVRVIEKYEWLKNYYNLTVDTLKLKKSMIIV